MQEVNIEAVAASASAELAKDFVNGTLKKLSGTSKEIFQRLFPKFQKHLEAVHSRLSQVKIIVNRDTPVRFNDIYVASRFMLGDTMMTDTEISSGVRSGKKFVVSAIGGAGKTFLLRHIWLSLFSDQRERVPVYLELRRLNAVSSLSLEAFVRTSTFGADFTENNFSHFAEEGTFIFLLDGFDEVVKDKRAELEAQISTLSQKYPKCGMIVSGRPDDRFGGWQAFSTVRALPLDYLQFRQLIERVPFDGGTKNSFLKIADREFFASHQSFLSNPLLSMMMLLTYRDNAEIPKKISTFYENCFATLFSQHDALKESFSREKCLDQLEFRRVFAVFCLLTYLDGRASVDSADFLSYVKRAKDYLRLRQETHAIAHDFLESVNLMIKEGTNVSFIHRSFQEFFSAVCVTSVLTDGIDSVLHQFATRNSDRTFKLAHEAHPALVNKEFVFPLYRNLKSSGKLVTRRDKTRPFRACAASGVDVGVDFEVLPLPERASSSGRIRIKRIVLSVDPSCEAFWFACDEAFFESDTYGKVRTALFHLFNSCFSLVKAERNKASQIVEGEWRYTVQFTDTEMIISRSAIDDIETEQPVQLTRSAQKSAIRHAAELEEAITSVSRRSMSAVEDAIALQTANMLVFVRDTNRITPSED